MIFPKELRVAIFSFFFASPKAFLRIWLCLCRCRKWVEENSLNLNEPPPRRQILRNCTGADKTLCVNTGDKNKLSAAAEDMSPEGRLKIRSQFHQNKNTGRIIVQTAVKLHKLGELWCKYLDFVYWLAWNNVLNERKANTVRSWHTMLKEWALMWCTITEETSETLHSALGSSGSFLKRQKTKRLVI